MNIFKRTGPKIDLCETPDRRIVFKSYTENYKKLLEKSSKPLMEIKRLRTLSTERFETRNNLNHEFIKKHF